jgi:8-amino-7-oxononanoate synthase
MAGASDLEHRVRAELAQSERDGLRRVLSPPSGIDLSSNDYLGLSRHPLLQKALAEGALREGCGSTGSRLLRGHRESFARVEQSFAAFRGAQSALYFSSGYLANLAVLSTFPQAGDVVYSDERNHASLIDGMRLARASRRIFRHNDAASLARLLRDETDPGQKFIVTESLFSMDGDFAPLERYRDLCREHNAVLIVDEAHTVGIYDSVRDDGRVLLSINAAGKALGVAGAFVAGPEWAIEYLIQRSRPFIFSTAPPPAMAAAIEAALSIIAAEPWRRTRLLSNAAYLRRHLNESGVTVPEGNSQIIPVLLGENERALRVAQILKAEGFDARAIRPPSVPEGTARLRLSVNAELSEEVLDRFVGVLTEALKDTACFAASS